MSLYVTFRQSFWLYDVPKVRTGFDEPDWNFIVQLVSMEAYASILMLYLSFERTYTSIIIIVLQLLFLIMGHIIANYSLEIFNQSMQERWLVVLLSICNLSGFLTYIKIYWQDTSKTFIQLQDVIDQKCLLEMIIHNLRESIVIFKDGKINHVNE